MPERGVFHVSATDDKSDSPEVFKLNDESILAGNDIRSEIHIAPGSSTVHYPGIIVTGGKIFCRQ